MASLKVEQYVVGMVHTNCYFAINEDTKETLVIDPGSNAGQLAERLDGRRTASGRDPADARAF